MATSLTVPDLILRLVKGQPLTAEEMDGNLEILRDFCNSLAELINASLGTDGALKDNTVETNAITARAVVAGKLDFKWLNLDTSTAANIFTISPDPAFEAYSDGAVFFILAANKNTSTCQINVSGLGLKPLKKRGGLELDANDILAGQVFCVCYYANRFELVSGVASGSGSGSSGVGGGFSGFQTYAPSDIDLPVGAAPVLVDDFEHGLGQTPTVVDVRLVCVLAELGYAAGDGVPIRQVVDGSGNESFTVEIGPSEITVNMVTDPRLANPTTGTITAIDKTKWRLRVYAAAITSASAATFPALNYTVRIPRGAFASGNDLFIAQYRSGTIFTGRLNIATNNFERVAPAAGTPYTGNLNVAVFRRASGVDNFVFTASEGIFYQPTISPFQPVFLTATVGSANYLRKPVHITESGGNIVQVLASGSRGESLSNLNMYANTSYNHGGSIGVIAGAVGAALDLTSSAILNAAGAAGNDEFRAMYSAGDTLQMFQYNRLKKRLYVIGTNLMCISIFQIVGNTAGYTDPNSLLEWWLDAGRLAKLQYIKSIMISGTGDYVVDQLNETYMIDVDLSTGDERAIVFSRGGNNPYAGSVTRVPWKE